MKANQKFIQSDDAVSPVIAVILMVAITVVLAATVYVWVSGFGSQGKQSQTLSLSEVSATNAGQATASDKFTIVSIGPNFLCKNLKATSTAGQVWTWDGSAPASDTNFKISQNGVNCATGNEVFKAGDQLGLNWGNAGGTGVAGPSNTATLNFIDLGSNNVMSTMTLHP
ncbi:MAG: archaellin/type IV pilin N-terminal domain-containing protein [Thermoplasmatota archaeon]